VNSGRFQKGRSGNPGGRPKVVGEIQELARQYTTKALDVLVQIMLDEKAPPNARIAAADKVIDRAYGRPPQFSTGSQQEFRRACEMSDDELAEIAQRGPSRPKLIELVVDKS